MFIRKNILGDLGYTNSMNTGSCVSSITTEESILNVETYDFLSIK